MSSFSVLLCAGTRPEIIKLAPVVHALIRSNVNTILVDTGQHETRITEPLYKFFGLEVTEHLNINRDTIGLADLNARLLFSLDTVLAKHKPSATIVQGDTASALQGALAAFFRHIPVAHIEAGLRTHDLCNPFPDELNRSSIARIARWNFSPTATARECLIKENVPGSIETVGNTIVDAIQLGLKKLADYERTHPESIPIKLLHEFSGCKRVVITAHRRENWDTGIRNIAIAVRHLLETNASLCFVWVLHPNPHVVESVRKIFDNLSKDMARRLQILPPLDYPEMLWLMRDAWLLVTDSGGIQEEAVALGLPVLITRNVTERPEVLECGAGHLVGTEPDKLCEAVTNLIANDSDYLAMCCSNRINPFGDGKASERIVASLIGSTEVP